MRLFLEQGAAALISNCTSDAVLGIILEDGTVRLRVGDPVRYPGHRAWIERDQLQRVFRGFSLIVLDRRVSALFCASILNAGRGAMLEPDLIEQLEALLPKCEGYRRFGD